MYFLQCGSFFFMGGPRSLAKIHLWASLTEQIKNQSRNVNVSVQKLAAFSSSQKTVSCQYKKRAKPLICLWMNKNPMALECFVCEEGENKGREGVIGLFSL